MPVLIAGGSGFLGTALQKHLRIEGHTVRVLTRRQSPGRSDQVEWNPDGTVGPWAESVEGADAIINLTGAGIADARWSAARKDILRQSRVLSTRSLALAIQSASRPPRALINASGVGYYGDRGGELVVEDTPAGSDFLATLCVDWEREAQLAETATRVVILRSGVVLDAAGGALARMLLPFRLGLGGRLGSGSQYFPWIHIADWIGLAVASVTRADAGGPFNATAPVPATNAQFTQALGRALRRPTVIPVPAFAIRLALGELADTLLTGQRAVPQRAEAMGYTFRFRDIDSALTDLLR